MTRGRYGGASGCSVSASGWSSRWSPWRCCSARSTIPRAAPRPAAGRHRRPWPPSSPGLFGYEDAFVRAGQAVPLVVTRRTAQLPAAGPLGRLGGVRRPGVGPRRPHPPALLAHPDDVLQLRGVLRPAGLRRQGHRPHRPPRGQPAPPGQPGPELRQGPGDAQPGLRPRAHPVPAEAGRPAGRGRVGADHVGPGAGRDRRPHRHGHPGGPWPTRSCTTSAGRATTASSSGCCTPGGWTRTTRTPTSARREPGSATRRGWGSTGPSPDHANADVIFLISSHLEAGHYFNPHAQRIIEGQQRGAKVICVDPRLSNTASMVDHWLPAWPGTEPVLLLALARLLLEAGTWDREFVRRWVNWETFLRETRPDLPVRVRLRRARAARPVRRVHARAGRASCAASTPRQIRAHRRADRRRAGPVLLAHLAGVRAPATREGGRRRAASWLLNVLTGSVGTAGGTSPNGWNKFIPIPPKPVHPHDQWNDMTWPAEYPLAHHEMSMLLPHFLKEGRGRLDTYFTRVYNPVWTNPDGFSWLEVLTDEELVGCHVALTPSWSETAWFADYVLPMGVGAERHDVASYETHTGRWIGFRQPVFKVFAEQQGQTVRPHLGGQPGRGLGGERVVDRPRLPHRPRRVARHPQPLRVAGAPRPADHGGRVLRAPVHPLGARAAGRGGRARASAPLQYMRRHGAFALPGDQHELHERLVTPSTSSTPPARVREDDGVLRVPGTAGRHERPRGHRRPHAVHRRRVHRASRSTASSGPASRPRRASWSSTPRCCGTGAGPSTRCRRGSRRTSTGRTSTSPAGERILMPTFRLPTMIHTRGGNSKWLNEISHGHPLWIHPSDAEQLEHRGRRPRPGQHPAGLVRHPGLADRGHPARRGRRLPPHGPVAARRRRGRRSGGRPGVAGITGPDGQRLRGAAAPAPSASGGRCASSRASRPSPPTTRTPSGCGGPTPASTRT